jgi:dolichyl-phosphate-mannose--protein O-mannosyl transferase
MTATGNHAPSSISPKVQTWIFLGVVVLLSYLTFFHRYWNPPYVFWDENYHIASAQKYLHGVFFMEQHPPLGKLLIALGEWLLHPNMRTDQFLGTDYGTQFGDGFSFAGYRFFSALLSWWTAPLLFLIFNRLLKNPLHATLASFLYIFDNALIVHSRGAMLEGPLMFFTALIFVAFFFLLEEHRHRQKLILWSMVFGASFALAMTTKVLSLIYILLTIPIAVRLWPSGKKIMTFAIASILPFIIIYCGVWWIHFSLGQTINPKLPDNGYYQASEEYKAAINAGTTSSLLMFPVMLRDSWHFVSHYNRGAPRLDLCKDDENGSAPFMWPLGARSINYRWQTPDGKAYRYLYLVANPVVWWGSFAALFLAVAMLVLPYLVPVQKPIKRRFELGTMIILYVCYMLAVSQITRVLYLYHYFIPLFFTFIIVALVFDELQSAGRKALNEQSKTAILLVFAAAIFVSHEFYRPLTYYEPLTKEQFERRAILPLWDMRCVNCDRNSPLVIPTK